MKLTFPYMGPVFAYRRLFETLGHEVIMPSKPSQRTVKLGTKHSPEFICFPFKIMLGSYLEAIEKGAEVIVTTGFIGACRAVYYGNLSERILHKLGYPVDVMVFDTPAEDFRGFMQNCRALGNGLPLLEVIKALELTIKLVFIHDDFQKKITHLRPYELNPGDCNRKWTQIQSLLESCRCLKDLKEVLKEANETIARIPINPTREVLKVGMVGEIYLVMESFANHEIEEKLAKLGVEVVRNQYISGWLKYCLFPPKDLLCQSDSYLKHSAGGHEKKNIGYILKYQQMGFDGIIHLLPFGCMPEMVTQCIIPTLSSRLDIPIISLALDEQTGATGQMIRLEAFVELLWTRYEQSKRGYRNEQNLYRR
ncbi:MAG TPA: 2-hydroxyacyl-CoA dehydratase [Bacillota bacterium]|nr:2-hydroxyacyl-CoA dehydratase [Bacillota bacterium]